MCDLRLPREVITFNFLQKSVTTVSTEAVDQLLETEYGYLSNLLNDVLCDLLVTPHPETPSPYPSIGKSSPCLTRFPWFKSPNETDLVFQYQVGVRGNHNPTEQLEEIESKE